MKKEIKLKNVKGSYDYSPEEQRIRNFIQDTLRSVFEEYAFQPLETPILCYYDMLAGKYDESNDLLQEIYKLSDQGQRELGLRYDLTVPFAKYISMQKDLRLPFKRYEIGKVFRDGPVKVGRDREFYQCDVDVVGLKGTLIEAELISLWLTGYKRLGIDVYIKYNSRNLMRGLIMEKGTTNDGDISKVVTIIDKLDKIPKQDILKEFSESSIDETTAESMLEDFSLNLTDLAKKYKNSNCQMLKDGLEEILDLENNLNQLGIRDDTVFSASLARGQDYYTGNVFEVYSKNNELACSLGGGGRYDKMITDFIDDGEEYPAVGVSFGLSTIYEILKARGDFKEKSLIDLYIIPVGTEIASLRIANEIRELGINVLVEMTSKKIKKCLENADREKIPYVIVLGEDELKNGEFDVKNMITKESVQIKLQELDKVKSIFY